MLSAIYFNLDQSEILLSGNGLTSTPHSILSKQPVLSHITIFKAKDSGERGMNSVVILYDYLQSSEYCPSRGLNQRPLVVKSCTLPAGPWSLVTD